jgi:hypothetical protein
MGAQISGLNQGKSGINKGVEECKNTIKPVKIYILSKIYLVIPHKSSHLSSVNRRNSLLKQYNLKNQRI